MIGDYTGGTWARAMRVWRGTGAAREYGSCRPTRLTPARRRRRDDPRYRGVNHERPVRKSYGAGRPGFIPAPGPGHIITASSRASSTWSADERKCGGESCPEFHRASRTRLILIFVPPFLPHQEINALADEPLECVVVRSGQDPIVVNLDIEGVADPEIVPWIDSTHPVA